jgi:hypothetical protein
VHTGKRKGSFRKIGVVLIAAAIIITLASWEWGGNGKHYATTMEGTHFYSPGTIERKNDGTATLEGRVEEERGWFTSVTRLYHYDFDCEGRRYIRYVEKETKRSGCSQETSAGMRRAKEAAPLLDVQPGSTVEKLFDIVCVKEKA